MVTPIEVLMARIATMENLAKAYANALVAYHQSEEGAYEAVLAAHVRLDQAAKELADTL